MALEIRAAVSAAVSGQESYFDGVKIAVGLRVVLLRVQNRLESNAEAAGALRDALVLRSLASGSETLASSPSAPMDLHLKYTANWPFYRPIFLLTSRISPRK